MGVKIQVRGVTKVLSSLEKRHLNGKVKLEGVVGYSAPHALSVHEDLEAYHDDGQAKFLEQPARELRPQLTGTVTNSVKKRRNLEEGIREACELLLSMSQKLVPVDTGELRDSGFVEIREITQLD